MTNDNCTIERIASHQLEQVRSMANKRLQENYTRELVDHFFENLNGCFLVAMEGEQLLGFIVAVPKDETSLRVLMLVVEEGYEGRGVGRKLMSAAEGYASSRKMGSIALEVGTSNEKAVVFYTRIGFRITGILDNYYEDRSDAFIMKKILPV
ncbi:MAG: GNAT family N-acetyltransferase [Candidatus Thermoplasmatota archaeon]|nr:GNAT family N-acetyltransferase [Candidatus Thermoplasmatota archaeon]